MDFLEFKKKLNNAFLSKIDFELSESECKQFFDFMNLLIEKNKVMNLTSITEPDEIILRHFVDSCMPLKFYDKICGKGSSGGGGSGGSKSNGNNNGCDGSNGDSGFETRLTKTRHSNFFKNANLVDIGTGAGFPGLPLAIVCSSAKFTLTDSLGKRINFLQEVIDMINISNVVLIKSRAEDFCNDKNFREGFDFVFSRGVAKLSVLSEYCLPAIKVHGKMISYKMNEIETELGEGKNAIKTLGGMFHEKHTYDLIENDPSRCLVVIDKILKTPKAYPRKAGTPAKSPL